MRCGRESLAEESATVPRGSRRRIDPRSRGKTESSFCNLLVRSCYDVGAVNDQLNTFSKHFKVVLGFRNYLALFLAGIVFGLKGPLKRVSLDLKVNRRRVV